MSEKLIDLTNIGSEYATINLLKMDLNQSSHSQWILSIVSVLLSFVANDINDDDDSDHSSTKSICQQISVVRLAMAILGKK